MILTLALLNIASGKIQGIVKDATTEEPIAYADVLILDTEIGAATDEQGRFFILNVETGMYTLEISCIGYQTKRLENVIVETGYATRLEIDITQTAIEIAPITVTSELPVVKKDYVGSTYIIRRTQLPHLPIDYTSQIVAFQAAVAMVDTAIHVRGGRVTEVQYMIDNIPINDPQTGDLAINISKKVIDEVIFLPGGFDVEYGRAMSGVVDLVTERPSDVLHAETHGKTERIMPYYYDYGYETWQSAIHLPIAKRLRGLVSLDVMHTDDWNPKLYIQPHKERDDYTVYTKWLYTPTGNLTFGLSGAHSRTQFDRYQHKFKFHLDHWRSDMRYGNFQALNISYLPTTRSLFKLTLSRLFTRRMYGVREAGPYGIFEDFEFRDYSTMEQAHPTFKNPFGVWARYYRMTGDYHEYQDKTSHLFRGCLSTRLQAHAYHEVNAGIEYTYMELDNFTHKISDSMHQINDEYRYNPVEYSIYVQNNVDYEGLYAKIGCRYDYYDADIADVDPKILLSPRFGFSFMVTERFMFRANVGRYVQPPLYDYIYPFYNIIPLPSYMQSPLVGNPDLEPEKTISYEIGLQGELRENVVATVNTFYKDVANLIGTRFVPALPKSYTSYFNVGYANVKGAEAIIEYGNPVFSGKLSYTISWARGTSSFADEVYYRYYAEDSDTSLTFEAREYYLDFDQRHRVFLQGNVSLPLQSKVYLFCYFGAGFPYTPPGPEGKYIDRNIYRLPFQRRIDCVMSKSFNIGKTVIRANLEIINVLNARYMIAPNTTWVPLESIKKEDFDDYIIFSAPYYSPAADRNHDGVISPSEEYNAFYELVQSTDDWVSAYTAPRRARLGISVSFQLGR